MGNAPVPPRSPFPGALSVYSLPIDPTHRQIKAWGVTGSVAFGSGILTDAGASFITDGISPGDPLVCIANTENEPFSTTVFLVQSETQMLINVMPSQTLTNCQYKTGANGLHTFDTLIAQMQELGLTTFTIRWGQLWAPIPSAFYNPGIDGSLITI